MLGVTLGRIDNPVLTKEMRTRMRGARAFWVLLGYVCVMSLVLFAGYLSWYQRFIAGHYGPMVGHVPVGRSLFQALFTAQAVMITAIIPALTAGMFTVEREQRTFELLMLTLLRPPQVVAGKLASAFGFTLLLLTASLPLAGICFMMGGISPTEVATVFVLVTSGGFLYAAIGLLCSALLRHTAMATVAAYMAVLFLAFGSGVLASDSDLLSTAVSPIGAVYHAMESAPFFGWRLPVALPALAVNVLGALLAMAGAIHHLEKGVSERPGTLRWLTLLLFTLLAFGTVGNVAGISSITATRFPDDIVALASLLLVALVALAFVFCTANAEELAARTRPAAPRSRWPFAGLWSARLFTGGYAWGPAYLLCLFLCGAAALLAPWLLLISAWAVAPETLGKSLLLVLSVLLGGIALARFGSVMTGSRQTAILLGVGVLAALVLLPFLPLIQWSAATPAARPPLTPLLALSPGIALHSLALGTATRPLWAGQEHAWVSTVFVYLAMAALLEGIGRAAFARRRRKATAVAGERAIGSEEQR